MIGVTSGSNPVWFASQGGAAGNSTYVVSPATDSRMNRRMNAAHRSRE